MVTMTMTMMMMMHDKWAVDRWKAEETAEAEREKIPESDTDTLSATKVAKLESCSSWSIKKRKRLLQF